LARSIPKIGIFPIFLRQKIGCSLAEIFEQQLGQDREVAMYETRLDITPVHWWVIFNAAVV
jgi:hypothetical protein